MFLRSEVAEFLMSNDSPEARERLSKAYVKAVLCKSGAQTKFELLVLAFLRGRCDSKKLRKALDEQRA